MVENKSGNFRTQYSSSKCRTAVNGLLCNFSSKVKDMPSSQLSFSSSLSAWISNSDRFFHDQDKAR